jgi:hypothetical protein
MHSQFCTPLVKSAQRIALLSLLAGVIGPSAAVGQTTFGTITGVVKDTTGAVVSGAAITISNESTNLTYRATTSPSGVYIQPNLLPEATVFMLRIQVSSPTSRPVSI